MSVINSVLQFYRVLEGAQEMNETLTPNERALVVFTTWLLIPCVAGVIIYYLFYYTARLVEYMGDVFFPETAEDKAKAAKATKGGAAATKKSAGAKKSSRKTGPPKKID